MVVAGRINNNSILEVSKTKTLAYWSCAIIRFLLPCCYERCISQAAEI
jgi:hypothetical protein